MIVGAIVLAAGRSTRMGANKLVADLGGKPVIVHVVDAIAGAKLPPPIVVTGHEQAAIEVALVDRDVRLVHAGDFALGLSRSLATGLRAVPADWDAAIICLGDMPLVSSALLGSLVDRAMPGAIVVPCRNGRRGNPVLWTRQHFAKLSAIEGDTGGRALMATLVDAVMEFECEDDASLIDVDTPAALAGLRTNIVREP